MNKNIVYVGNRYPPYHGEVQVFFREHGTPKPGTYELIARVGGSLGWGRPAIFDKGMHDWLKEQAAQAGGNGVIIECGAVGTIGQNSCTGDVIRFK